MGGIKMMEVKAGNARYSRTIAKFSSLPLLLAHLACVLQATQGSIILDSNRYNILFYNI